MIGQIDNGPRMRFNFVQFDERKLAPEGHKPRSNNSHCSLATQTTPVVECAMRKLTLALVAVFATQVSYAGIGPENVMLVVNGDSRDSLRVANAYVNLRKIPANNVVVLKGLSGTEYIDVEGFRKQILTPTMATIESRGLTKQIDCITYSVDIPYSVNVSGDVKGRKLSQVITQTASTNGLTYLMDWTKDSNIDYLRLDINNYTRRRLPIASGNPLTAQEQVALGEAMAAYDAKDYKKAIIGLEKLVSRSDPSIAYNLACSYALDGQKDEAIAALRKAVAKGWRNHGQTASDSDFNSIKDREDFRKLLDTMRLSPVEVQPSAPFQRNVGWNREGGEDATGAKYMLSTFLGVTAGRGNTVEEVVESLRRAKSADFSSPKGTIYFEKNKDVRSTTREWGFQAAAQQLLMMDINAVVEDGILPKEKNDVAGGMIGISDFNWPDSKSTILPGAIVEHLTSFGGMINKGAGQTAATEFIRNGAAGTSGTVTEPFALQEKFPSPFIHVHYARGYTLAESFYMSLSGPYQLLIIGDPLCKPWAKKAEVKVAGLTDGQTVAKALTLKPTITAGTPVFEYHLFVDGKVISSSDSGSGLVLDPKAYAEGYHEVVVVAERADTTRALYQTSYRVIFPGSNRKIVVPDKISTEVGKPVEFKVSAAGATSIELFHLGRSVGSCGVSGVISVPTSQLGAGTSTVYPVATFGSTKVYGKPITVVIEP